jgi:hypothetical protein
MVHLYTECVKGINDILSDLDIFGPLPTDIAVNLLKLDEWNMEINERVDWPLIIAKYIEYGSWPEGISIGLKR